MLRVCGVIVEYNPFHHGHFLHIKAAKEQTCADYLVAVMSGHYVQRGEPAVCSKWLRTKMALLAGVDLVVELPVVYATASASYFAQAATALLNHCGVVNSLCFGSESGNIESLSKIALSFSQETNEAKSKLHQQLKLGVSYPRARQMAFSHVPPLNKPNDILAVEYLLALHKQKSSIVPHTIKRTGADYHDENIFSNIASASAIRKQLFTSQQGAHTNHNNPLFDAMPAFSSTLLQTELKHKNAIPLQLDHFSHFFHALLATQTPKQLTQINGMKEGLENRMLSCAKEHFLISHVVSAMKTKRYTHTQLQRLVLHVLLQISALAFEAHNQNGFSPYIRILGFRRESEMLLKQIAKHATLPLLTNPKYAQKTLTKLGFSMFQHEIFATQMYWLAQHAYGIKQKDEMQSQLVIV